MCRSWRSEAQWFQPLLSMVARETISLKINNNNDHQEKDKLLGLGQVSHFWVWKIYPKNHKFFNFFPSGQKKSHRVWSTRVKDGLASYLLQVKSMPWVGSGPISKKRLNNHPTVRWWNKNFKKLPLFFTLVPIFCTVVRKLHNWCCK